MIRFSPSSLARAGFCRFFASFASWPMLIAGAPSSNAPAIRARDLGWNFIVTVPLLLDGPRTGRFSPGCAPATGPTPGAGRGVGPTGGANIKASIASAGGEARRRTSLPRPSQAPPQKVEGSLAVDAVAAGLVFDLGAIGD